MNPSGFLVEGRGSVDKSVSTALALSANLPMRPAGVAPGTRIARYRGVSRKRSSSLSVPRMKNVLGSMVRS